jgi:hypothetical protein
LKPTRNVSKKGNYFQYSITKAKTVCAEKVQYKQRHTSRLAVAESMNDTVNDFRNHLISSGNVFPAHSIAVYEGLSVERCRSPGSVDSQL